MDSTLDALNETELTPVFGFDNCLLTTAAPLDKARVAKTTQTENNGNG